MSRLNEIKKRHLDRKKMKSDMRPIRLNDPVASGRVPYGKECQKTGESYPLFKTNRFLFKCIVAALLILVAIISERSMDSRFNTVRSVMEKSFANDFQFTEVSKWYESKFGQPLAFFPSQTKTDNRSEQKTTKSTSSNAIAFSQPVAGEVKEQFSDLKQGILVQTTPKSKVEAVKDGIVVFVGEKKETGKTIIVQHQNGAESWYGRLNKVHVKIYDNVKKGQDLGIVSDDTNDKHGSFYFALKEDGKFVDPATLFQ
ncbi:peptidoglycan DD-metalloendopeptidase family protein [Terrilactibacillus sp. BCM23-1]|uniref:Peptidoglycan DD-metalloendopeptidase family protein n=1 Tax=Terrilactibacillus tamarindi TaxID=2599694 RepID=A0A6N8CQJ0_9BACI|nr:M23 family metallopeptidase [Terrilactibacillus tamarindi]MTT32414.1 peptidoglycan DD-metalloendopeptidase family protein [Terrilactibacillus tamarindi]